MKKYLFSMVTVILGILCFVSYNIIGSEVLADGTLKEPFFLIPLAYLFLFSAVLSFLIIWIRFTLLKNK